MGNKHTDENAREFEANLQDLLIFHVHAALLLSQLIELRQAMSDVANSFDHLIAQIRKTETRFKELQKQDELLKKKHKSQKK